MERSFRTLVLKQSSVPLSDGLSLENGAGPTVLRSLTEPRYFATVLQCSMLTWVHERASLAAAISQIFERENEEAPPGHISKAVPSQEGILGVLKACEVQTSAYNWSGQIRAVASVLGIPDTKTFQPLPAVILRAVVYMFPIVQSLPEDRSIVVWTERGVCILVVWAHFVLGLTVLVKLNPDDNTSTRKFGADSEQLVILVEQPFSGPSVTLLETTSKHGELFTLQPDPDEFVIEGIIKSPARGFGMQWLNSVCVMQGSKAIVEEMKLISSAFAMIVAENTFMAFGTEMSHLYDESDDDAVPNGLLFAEGAMRMSTSGGQLMDAAKLLFDDTTLRDSSICNYADVYSKTSLTSLEPTRTVKAVLDQMSPLQEHDRQQFWFNLMSVARSLAVIILAFAHIQNLSSCEDLLLCNSPGILSEHVLVSQLDTWDGLKGLRVPEDVWFHAISLLIIGHKEGADRKSMKSMALVSDRGWSVYLCTFGFPDPTFVHAGSIKVEKGVPSKHGIRKHKIMDGPLAQFDKGWGFEEVVRGQASNFAPKNIAQGRSLCGERSDAFVVNLRIVLQRNNAEDVRRTGYRELAWALWIVTKTRSCQHSRRAPADLDLPVGCAGVSGFWEWDHEDLNERVVVALTAGNSSARWRALVAAAHGRYRDPPSSVPHLKHILLRGPECCMSCALDEALTKDGRCLLIL